MSNAVIITAIICGTLIVITWLTERGKKNGGEKNE